MTRSLAGPGWMRHSQDGKRATMATWRKQRKILRSKEIRTRKGLGSTKRPIGKLEREEDFKIKHPN